MAMLNGHQEHKKNKRSQVRRLMQLTATSWFSILTKLLCSSFTVFHVFLPLPVSSENFNGTRGAPWLWPCQHTFSEPFHPEQSFIYWQGQNNGNVVVHFYAKGRQEFQHQGPSFRNRTKIFPDQLASGNFSLLIDPLMLKDDQTSLEVVVLSGNRPREKLCQTTVYVSGMMLGTFHVYGK